MAEQYTISAFIPALPIAVYLAWMDGDIHREMTGANADSAPVVGRAFSAWDGYITGINLELEPGRRIVQSWRTREFPEDAPDSRVTISLLPEGNGTRLTIMHQGVPDGQGEKYRRGWHENYFRPMQEYFVGEGIAGAPADAGVTEVIRRVSRGEAGLPPEMPDEGLDDVPEADSVAAGRMEAPIGDVNAIGTYASAAGDKPHEGHAPFEPVDDDQEDEALDTSDTREEWWGHLKPPKETRKVDKEEKIPETEPELNRPDDLKAERKQKPKATSEGAAGTRRKRARRKPLGAGKPAKKTAKGRKTGARATKRKPAKKSPAGRKKTTGKATRKKPAGSKTAAKKSKDKATRTAMKPAKKSAKAKQTAKKKPTGKAAAKTRKSTKQAATKKKPARKPAAKTKKKPASRKTGATRGKAAKKSTTRKKPAAKSKARTKKTAGARTTKKRTTGRKSAAARKKPKKKPASPKRAAGKKPRKGRKG